MSRFLLKLVFVTLLICLTNSQAFSSDCISLFATAFSRFSAPPLKLDKSDISALLKIHDPFLRYTQFASIDKKSVHSFSGDFRSFNSSQEILPVVNVNGVFIKPASLSSISFLKNIKKKTSLHLSFLKLLRSSFYFDLETEIKQFIKQVLLLPLVPKIQNNESIENLYVFNQLGDALHNSNLRTNYPYIYSFLKDHPELQLVLEDVILGIVYKLIPKIYIKPVLGILSDSTIKIPKFFLPKQEDRVLSFIYQGKYLPVNQDDLLAASSAGYMSCSLIKFKDFSTSSFLKDFNLVTTPTKYQQALMNTFSIFYHLIPDSEVHILNFLYPLAQSVVSIDLIHNSSSDSNFSPTSGCSAVILSHNTILTAGHCLDNVKTVTYDNGTIHSSKAIYIHPQYNTSSLISEHDIGIVRFPDGTFSNLIPVPISTSRPELLEDLIVVGTRGTYSSRKIALQKRVLPSSEFIADIDEVSPDVLVTSSVDKKNTPLQCGDSGGAIFNSKNQLVGIHSSSIPNNFDSAYDFHSFMDTNLDFINQIIKEDPSIDPPIIQ